MQQRACEEIAAAISRSSPRKREPSALPQELDPRAGVSGGGVSFHKLWGAIEPAAPLFCAGRI